MCFLLEVGHEDTCKTNRLEVADISHFLHSCAVAFQRNLELIPLHCSHLIVTQFDGCLHDAGYVLLSYTLQILWAQRYVIAIETLAIVQRIIVVYVLYIRVKGGRTTISLILLCFRRVAFGAIVAFVAQ